MRREDKRKNGSDEVTVIEFVHKENRSVNLIIDFEKFKFVPDGYFNEAETE